MNWLDPILRSLARLAIRKGWLFPMLETRLRLAYLAAAREEAGPKTTDSKISVLTGLQRRDIARLRNEPDTPLAHRQPLAEIIAHWRSHPDYDPEGIPAVGEGASFATVARDIRQDVHPRTFLDVLIETGAVSELDGQVRLLSDTYQPLPGSDDQMAYLGDNIGDHLSTAVSNVVDKTNAYDMAVHYTGLSADAVSTLDAHFRPRMTALLQDMDAMARDLPHTDDGPYRFRAGGYFFDNSKGAPK